MTEADPTTMDNSNIDATEDSASTLLSGLENGDLSTGIYEGGFKTWECALDLATYLLSQFSNEDAWKEGWSIIELGAGSAVPSLALQVRYMETWSNLRYEQDRKWPDKPAGISRLHLTLCDYNEEVLRMCTAPNVFVTYLFTNNEIPKEDENEQEGEIDIQDFGAENFVEGTIWSIAQRNIDVDFVSGSWGPEFVNLLAPPSPTAEDTSQPSNLLILASETIYSPSTLKPFTSTLLSLLRAHSTTHQTPQPQPSARALIAAKKVYFGVGGGIDEFIREATSSGALCEVIYESKDTGVGRVIVEVKLKLC
jgi:protein-histidine N-methyltransferase